VKGVYQTEDTFYTNVLNTAADLCSGMCEWHAVLDTDIDGQ
jgi:hypothetical protein